MHRFTPLTCLLLAMGCANTDSDKPGSDGGAATGTEDSGDTAVSDDSGTTEDTGTAGSVVDPNGDGVLHILILGTNQSVDPLTSFAPDGIATALQEMLDADPPEDATVQVVAEDTHMSESVDIGLGGGGDIYTYTHHSHSLLQYYYWPTDKDERWDRLSSAGDTVWDYVVLTGDPHVVAHTPGYYALGVHKVAAKVASGGAQPLLLMMWPEEGTTASSVAHFEEFTYRASAGAPVSLPVVPAGLAWDALSDGDRDSARSHPTPGGERLAAAAIYSHLSGKTATEGDPLADAAYTAVVEAAGAEHYTGARTFVSPFAPCGVTDEVISYNQTGSSSERGILDGLNWVFNQAPQSLQNGGTTPITFNYGRANTNFEPGKRYQIDAERFAFSFGFPMQDHGNTGDTSMLYGIDYRNSGVVNDTDLGVAEYMVEQGELPTGRAVPIRALFAQMHELNPSQSAYRDSWHMHRDLDKAIGAYMYSLLTGECALGEEPADTASAEWSTWAAHRIGCDTAWTFMHLESSRPE